MRNLRIQSIVSVVLAIAVMQTRAVASEYVFPSNRPVPASFATIINSLRAQTAVPILLPAEMVGAPNTTIGEIVAVTETNYTVQMSMGKLCHKGMYCRFGTVHGELISTLTPPLTGTRVKVEPGITGYYAPAVCAANCNESTLVFRFDGYQYMVGIEAGSQSSVLRTAQSLEMFGAPQRFNPLDVVLRLSSDKPTYYVDDSHTEIWDVL